MWWSGEWCSWTVCFDFVISPTGAMLSRGNFSAKSHGRSKCHLWIQYGPYIIILAFLTYVHNMFHLHPLRRPEDVLKVRLSTFPFTSCVKGIYTNYFYNILHSFFWQLNSENAVFLSSYTFNVFTYLLFLCYKKLIGKLCFCI